MPWQPQVCPFCHKRYANKEGLRIHLSWHVGEWRFPADGIHDVLKINRILHPGQDGATYKCPACSVIFNRRREFVDHVFYRKHYGIYGNSHDQGTKRRSRAWPFPFDEDAVKVFKPKGVFRFLHLPFDLRHIVYTYVVRFSEVKLKHANTVLNTLNQNGVWLQHNPQNNPLSLLMVNRQIYEEARHVFYGLNTFVFDSMQALPVFLIGIGRENTLMLRSVIWENDHIQHENCVETIRSCLSKEGSTETERADIWNNDAQYTRFLESLHLGSLSSFNWTDCRLLRLDTDDQSARDVRKRFGLSFVLKDYGTHGMTKRQGSVSYDLYRRPLMHLNRI